MCRELDVSVSGDSAWAQPRLFAQQPDDALSMSGKGNCYDNAVTETVFKTLKMKWIYGTSYADEQKLRRGASEYISCFTTGNICSLRWATSIRLSSCVCSVTSIPNSPVTFRVIASHPYPAPYRTRTMDSVYICSRKSAANSEKEIGLKPRFINSSSTPD